MPEPRNSLCGIHSRGNEKKMTLLLWLCISNFKKSSHWLFFIKTRQGGFDKKAMNMNV